MPLEPLQPRRFDSGSPVAAYWLTRCEGFRVVVRHRDAGTVEQTVFDDDPLRPFAVRVRRSRGRTALLPLAELEAVQPLARVLHFRSPATARRPSRLRRGPAAAHLRRAGSRTLATTVALSRWTGLRLRRLAHAAARTAARNWPRLRSLLVTLARVAVALLAVLATLAFVVCERLARKLAELVRAAAARRQPSRAG